MNRYIGSKLINAEPMTRLDYNKFRGWTPPEDENGNDAGYLTEIINGAANTSTYDGYVSWSPKEGFEKEYRKTDGLTFGLAIEAVKIGKKIARTGWNEKGMFVFYVNGSKFTVSRPPLLGILPVGTEVVYKGHLDMCHADGSIGVWPVTTNDVLAEDWVILD